MAFLVSQRRAPTSPAAVFFGFVPWESPSAAPGCAPTSFDLGRGSQVCNTAILSQGLGSSRITVSRFVSWLSAAKRFGSLVSKRSSWSAVGAPPRSTCASGPPSPDDVLRTCGPPVGSAAVPSVTPPSVPPASLLPRLHRTPTGRRALQYCGKCCCLLSTHTPLPHLLQHRVEVSLLPHEIAPRMRRILPDLGYGLRLLL